MMIQNLSPHPLSIHSTLLCLEACIPGPELGTEGSIKKPGDRASCSAIAALTILQHPYHVCVLSRHKYLVVQVTLRTLATPSKDTEFQLQKNKISFRVLRFTIHHSFTFTSENPPFIPNIDLDFTSGKATVKMCYFPNCSSNCTFPLVFQSWYLG